MLFVHSRIVRHRSDGPLKHSLALEYVQDIGCKGGETFQAVPTCLSFNSHSLVATARVTLCDLGCQSGFTVLNVMDG